MPFGLAPLSLHAAYILASMGSACPAQGHVVVNVHVNETDSPYITTQTSSELTRNFGGKLNTSLASDGKWMISGLTDYSGTDPDMHAQFATMHNPRTNQTCFSVSTVDYTINYKPVVYIAHDYLQMGCRYSATLMHEKRHVSMSMSTIQDFAPDMSAEIEKTAEAMPPQGPFADAAVQGQMQGVLQHLDASLAPIAEQLRAKLRERNATIDTVQAYTRDTGICPGQFPKFDGSK